MSAVIFDWELIQTNKTSGTAKVKCPVCNDTRRNKADKSLYVRFDSGVAKCFHCEALSFRESIKKAVEVKYTLPEQEVWKNYTSLSDGLVKWFEGRGIQQFVLKKMNVTEEKYYQPAKQKEVNNVVFNYFEGDVLVNKKYRSASKDFTQTKNGKPIFYNINSVIGAKECYIVEGEIDALSIIQIGIENVVSVPNGANDNDAYWINSEPYLKSIEKFYIATDRDGKGEELAEKMAQRLGRWRCERVLFEGKDANEDLKAGVLETTIFTTKKYPVSGTFTVSDLYDKIINLYDSGLPPTIKVKNRHFGDFNDVFQLMMGHLCVGTGIPSHGKSNFTEWYVLNLLIENDYKASFFSPEHQPMQLHHSTFIQKITGKNFFREIDGAPRVSKHEIAQYHDWANQRLYLTSPEAGTFATWDWVFERFREQMFQFGINIFVIDAYNKVEHTGKATERENISKVLSRLASFAQENNVLIILIAHPTKMRKKESGEYEAPTLYDVAGSADFRNQAHDGFCVYRHFGDDDWTDFINLKTKYTFQGQIAKRVEFDYHLPSGRYYVRGESPQTENLLESAKEKEYLEHKDALPFVYPKNAFYDQQRNKYEDEVPF